MSIRQHRNRILQSRFSWNGSVLLTLVFSFACPCNDTSIAQTKESNSRDWPGFLGAERDGKSLQKGILKRWDDGKLKKLWTRSIGESYASPSIVGDRAYFFERVDRKNTLRCLSIKDGKQIWSYQYDTDYSDMYGYNNGPRCAPLIDEGLVYTNGPEGEIHVL